MTMNDITGFSETEFMNYIRECGCRRLRRPDTLSITGLTGGSSRRRHMTESQRGHLWRALNKIRFFEIVETETE